jgi:hypothetical protein
VGTVRFLGYLGVFAATSGVMVAGAVAAGVGPVHRAEAPAVAAAAADDPGSIVETFDYPDAARIQTERGILLKRGDGHLLLTDCVTGGDFIEVRARNQDPYCFTASKPSGWVTLELQDAFLVFSDSTHTTVADYTINGVSDSTTIEPGGAEGIGEGTTPGQRAVLLELRVG